MQFAQMCSGLFGSCLHNRHLWCVLLCCGLTKSDVIRSEFNGCCSTCANATSFQSFAALYKTPLSWRNTRFVHKSDDLQKIARMFHHVTSRECNSSRSNHQHCCCRPLFHTHCPSRLKSVSNHCTTRGLPFKFRPNLFQSLHINLSGLLHSSGQFFSQCPKSALSIAQMSCARCPASVLLRVTRTLTVRRAVGFLHEIPFLHDFPACPLSWLPQTSVQARSR